MKLRRVRGQVYRLDDVDLTQVEVPDEDRFGSAPEEYTSSHQKDFVPVTAPIFLRPPDELLGWSGSDTSNSAPSSASTSRSATPLPAAGIPDDQVRKRKQVQDYTAEERAEYDKAKAHERGVAKKRARILRQVDGQRALKGRGPRFYALMLFQVEKYGQPEALSLGIDAEADIKAAQGAYVGPMGRKKTASDTPPKLLSLEWCSEQGYRLISWDGRTPKVVTDVHDRILVAMAGRPKKEVSWGKAMDGLDDFLTQLKQKMRLICESCRSKPPEQHCKACSNRRGDFRAVSFGLSFGGGQSRPQMLKQHPANISAIQEVMQQEGYRRGIGFQNSCSASYGPNMYADMSDQLPLLYERDDSLEVLLDNTVYPAQTLNLGPQAITALHFDAKNKSNYYIAVTALGRFDPQKGGHLVIKTLRLVIEFPPHSTILFLSSVLEHANIPVQSHETRSSITQYAAGGLFRWIDNGFQSERSLTGGSKLAAKELRESRKDNWVKAVGLLSKVGELEADQKRLIKTLNERWEEEEKKKREVP